MNYERENGEDEEADDEERRSVMKQMNIVLVKSQLGTCIYYLVKILWVRMMILMSLY